MTAALIAGAGPVGLTLALELARYRVPVRIVDRAPARTDLSKALAVWPRTLELLDRTGCAETFVTNGLRCPAANILSGKERIARIEFIDIRSAFPFVLILPQSETERLLEEKLQTLGIVVERNTELIGFADAGEGVTCTLRRGDGATEAARVDWLIGCDGAHSTVRHLLGLDFAGDTLVQSFALADVRATDVPAPEGEIAIFWSADGVLLFFPIAAGRFRIIADMGAEARQEPTLAEMQAIADARTPGGVTLSDPIWLSSFTINERMVPDYRRGRVFVAGDAAHIHSPAGGQGMNTGMQDAFNLAWKLALAHRGLAGSRLLDTYGVERSGVAKEVLSDSGRMTRAGLLRHPAAQTMRNLVVHGLLGFEGLRNRAAAHLCELTVGYPDSPLNRGRASQAAPGDRIVVERPFGAGDAPRFAILADDSPDARRFLADHAGLMEPTLRPALTDGAIRLVRPDGYVVAVAAADEWQVLKGCLGQLADPPDEGS